MSPIAALFILSAFISVSSSYQLKVTPEETEFVRAIGQSMMLTCSLVDNSGDLRRLSLQWKNPRGVVVTESLTNRVYTEKESTEVNRLYITNIQSSDAGRYSCELIVAATKRTQHSVVLTIFKDITFDNAPNIQHPEIYTDALIQCRVSAEPKPEVSWRFKNRNLEQSGRYVVEDNGLRIRNISSHDNGVYTCRAEVKVNGRYDERRINVAVHVRPQFTKHLDNVQAKEGDHLIVSCHARGLPMPKYEFLKHKAKLTSVDESRIIIDNDNGRIQFRPLRKSDEGEYTCVAINDVGEVKSTANIHVLVRPEITELHNVTVVEGATATLLCKTRGDPIPSVIFHKIGFRYHYNSTNENGRILVHSSSDRAQLEIRHVTMNDSGNYTCTSNNSAGYDSKVGQIVVEYKPKFSAEMNENNKFVYIWPGKTHNVSCKIFAEPSADIEWLRHGRVIENNDTYHVFKMASTSNLQVRVKEADKSWIYGIYSC